MGVQKGKVKEKRKPGYERLSVVVRVGYVDEFVVGREGFLQRLVTRIRFSGLAPDDRRGLQCIVRFCIDQCVAFWTTYGPLDLTSPMSRWL